MRLICATRGVLQETLLYRSVRYLGMCKAELHIIQNNTEGLSTVYNRSIREGILCFIHDDVIICDFWWNEVIEEGLKKFDIVGVAGNRRIPSDHSSWCIVGEACGAQFQIDREYLSGCIAQGESLPCDRYEYFGPCGEVKLLDGVFMAVKGETLLKTGLRFDEDFKFHFYDLAFCRRAVALGLTLGTIPLSLVHKSPGNLNQEWRENLALYRLKYAQ